MKCNNNLSSSTTVRLVKLTMKGFVPTIFESLKTDQSKNLFKDYSEIAIDSLIESQTVKNLPIVNTLVNSVGFVISVREHILTKKLCGFISKAADISSEEKSSFLEKLDNDLNLKVKVGEKILLTLEQADDVDKSILAGCIFQAYMKNEISYKEMSLMFSGINKVPLEYLSLYLLNKNSIDVENNISLYFCGFVSPTQITVKNLVVTSFHDTELGVKFKSIINKCK